MSHGLRSARPVRRAIAIDSFAAGSPLASFADVMTSVPPFTYPSKTVSVTLEFGDSTSPFALNLMQRNAAVALESGVKVKDVDGVNVVGSARLESGEVPAARIAT